MPIWLTITMEASMIMANLIAPLLAKWVELRMLQPKNTPVPNQPKKRIQRVMESVFKICRSPFIFPPLIIAINTYSLLIAMSHANPLTAIKVLVISATTSSIVFGLLYMLVLHLANWISDASTLGINNANAVLEIRDILATMQPTLQSEKGSTNKKSKGKQTHRE